MMNDFERLYKNHDAALNESRKQRVSMNSIKPEVDRYNYGASYQSRHLDPSIRSIYFDSGEGLQTIANGSSTILAGWSFIQGHSGVVKQFYQNFNGNSAAGITWQLRYRGRAIPGFDDFVGELSSLIIGRDINFYAIGSDTVGSDNTSGNYNFTLSAENNTGGPITIEGRISGWMFPVDEQVDNFRNY